MDDILVAVLSMLLIFALVPLFIWKRRYDSNAAVSHEDDPQVLILMGFLSDFFWSFLFILILYEF